MQNMYSDMMKMWTQMKTPMPMQMGMPPVPSVNMDDIVAIGKRNMEACSEAAACVTEGIQTIARRQADLARGNVQKVLKTSKDMLVNGSPEINTSKQAEFAKTMIEQSMNNLREVTELVAKSGFEAFDVLNKRAAEHFEELSSFGKKSA